MTAVWFVLVCAAGYGLAKALDWALARSAWDEAKRWEALTKALSPKGTDEEEES